VSLLTFSAGSVRKEVSVKMLLWVRQLFWQRRNKLAEGYRANAEVDRRICEEFCYVDDE
jgi:hypothetical protein